MSLPPIYFHYFQTPLPYVRTLALQERLHAIQLAQCRLGTHKDMLLLLQHRPVYTAGRRQSSDDPEIMSEEARLTRLGADFVTTQRGGQITYHGPGQIVGYPLLDLGRTAPPLHIRDYICKMQTALKRHFREAHGISSAPSDNTGVFLDEHTKLASIGVQVRHRLTTHGFAFNVTPEPLAWFDQVVACGLADVKAGCITGASGARDGGEVTVEGEIEGLVERFGRVFGRDMQKLDVREGEVGEAIMALDEEAAAAGPWAQAPAASRT